jgi:hypothetical protein
MLRGTAPIYSASLMAALFALAPCPAQAQSRVNGAEQADYWTVNTALPSQYSERSRPQPKPPAERTRPATPGDNRAPIGRVPLRDAPGSIGFTSGPSTSSGQFHDGRTVPGLNPNTQKESSYVGVSLSVTSASKGLPIPVPTPWSRPE